MMEHFLSFFFGLLGALCALIFGRKHLKGIADSYREINTVQKLLDVNQELKTSLEKERETVSKMTAEIEQLQKQVDASNTSIAYLRQRADDQSKIIRTLEERIENLAQQVLKNSLHGNRTDSNAN